LVVGRQGSVEPGRINDPEAVGNGLYQNRHQLGLIVVAFSRWPTYGPSSENWNSVEPNRRSDHHKHHKPQSAQYRHQKETPT
jgi:hypothetical protein